MPFLQRIPVTDFNIFVTCLDSHQVPQKGHWPDTSRASSPSLTGRDSESDTSGYEPQAVTTSRRRPRVRQNVTSDSSSPLSITELADISSESSATPADIGLLCPLPLHRACACFSNAALGAKQVPTVLSKLPTTFLARRFTPTPWLITKLFGKITLVLFQLLLALGPSPLLTACFTTCGCSPTHSSDASEAPNTPSILLRGPDSSYSLFLRTSPEHSSPPCCGFAGGRANRRRYLRRCPVG